MIKRKAGITSWILSLILGLTSTISVADPQTEQAMLEEAHVRLHFMVRASHILLALPEAASSDAVAWV